MISFKKLMKLKTQRKAENERRKCSLRRTLPSKARIHISCCSYFILIILLPHFLSCCSYYPTFWVIFKQFWCSVKTNMWTSSWISFSSLQARPIQLHPQLQQVRSVGSTSIQTLLKRLFCTLISGWWALIAEERIRTQLIALSVSQVTTCHLSLVTCDLSHSNNLSQAEMEMDNLLLFPISHICLETTQSPLVISWWLPRKLPNVCLQSHIHWLADDEDDWQIFNNKDDGNN